MLLMRFTLSLVLIFVTGGVAADCKTMNPEAMEWLDKMSRSAREVSYQGVITLQRGDDMQVVQVSQHLREGYRKEVMTQLTGQGAQVQRDHPLHCVHPGQEFLRFGEQMRLGDCGIAQQYRFSVTKGDRVAGRRSVQVRIEPRDMYRYGYLMSLDRKTGLLLKTETLGHGRRPLERFQFANLQVTNLQVTDKIPPNSSEVEVLHAAQHPHPDHPSVSSSISESWRIQWVPSGFTPTDSPDNIQSRRTYTDGLAVFSVFIEDLDRPIDPGEGLVRKGGTTSYTRGMEIAQKPVLVTVLGEVPVNTARMVADSVSWMR